MRIGKNQKAQSTDGVMDTAVIIGKFLRAENMVSVHAVCEIVIGQVCAVHGQYRIFQSQMINSYPESIISSSMPYSFIC